MTNTWVPAPGHSGGPSIVRPRKFTGVVLLPVGLVLTVLSAPVAYFLAGFAEWYTDGTIPLAVSQAEDHFNHHVVPLTIAVTVGIGLALVVLAVTLGTVGRPVDVVIQRLCIFTLMALPWIWLIVIWNMIIHMLKAAGVDFGSGQ
jgi:hypothetical protein